MGTRRPIFLIAVLSNYLDIQNHMYDYEGMRLTFRWSLLFGFDILGRFLRGNGRPRVLGLESELRHWPTGRTFWTIRYLKMTPISYWGETSINLWWCSVIRKSSGSQDRRQENLNIIVNVMQHEQKRERSGEEWPEVLPMRVNDFTSTFYNKFTIAILIFGLNIIHCNCWLCDIQIEYCFL